MIMREQAFATGGSPSSGQAAKGTELEASIAAAIEACNGDLRAAVRALLVTNASLMEELVRARALQSRGYVGGRKDWI